VVQGPKWAVLPVAAGGQGGEERLERGVALGWRRAGTFLYKTTGRCLGLVLGFFLLLVEPLARNSG
jgi:hypothetical protein